MTDQEVHEAFVRWLAAETGLVTIKSYQGGDPPAKPYLMVNLLSVREVREHPQGVEYTETQNLNSAGQLEVSAAPVIEVEWEFSTHAYGENPTDLLRPIKSRSKLVQRLEPMYPALVVHDTGQINFVPDFINEKWEPRAQMNVSVRGLIRDAVVVDVIDDASVDVSKV